MQTTQNLLFMAGLVVSFAPFAPLSAQKLPGTKSGFVRTADGVKIHYLEASAPRQAFARRMPMNERSADAPPHVFVTPPPAILFVPGWTMPAWIWEHQIAHFSKTHRVVAMDPRGQGESSKPNDGYYPAQRARDIRAVVEKLKLAPVVLVGWSMGVTEVAAYVDQFGTADVAAIVLVDGIAGGGTDMLTTPEFWNWWAGFLTERPKQTEAFVRTMYRKSQSEDYLKRVTQTALLTPSDSAIALFLGLFAADHRAALAKMDKPTLIVGAGDEKTNPWIKKFQEMQQLAPGARLELFPDCGHALFVDDPARFNSLLDQFLASSPRAL